MFELGVRGIADPLEVISFSGSEPLSGLYRYEILVAYPDDDDSLDALESALLGRPAYLRIPVEEQADRFVHGIMTEFAIEGGSQKPGKARLRVTLAPRLSLLTMRQRSRIFQDLTVEQIVDQVLDEMGIRRQWRLRRSLPRRTYCTQHQETDYDFVARLLADEGIFHFLSHPASAQNWDPTPDGAAGRAHEESTEIVVLGDESSAYNAIADADAAAALSGGPATEGNDAPSTTGALGENLPTLTYRHSEGNLPSDNEIHSFVLQRSVRPRAALLSDYDFRHPALKLRAEYRLGDAPAARKAVTAQQAHRAGSHQHGAGVQVGALRIHEHRDRQQEYFEDQDSAPAVADIERQRARRSLEQLRAQAKLARGFSHCRRLVPGHTFRLSGHPIGRLDGDYVVTEICSEGKAPRWHDQSASDAVFAASFTCAPRQLAVRPAPILRPRQIAETATVTGPQNEAIYTDEHGRIQVRFHWDIEHRDIEHRGIEHRDIEHSDPVGTSCWLRCSQDWAGPGWGQQFIPRVGMEVLVTFLGGDPDRPLVTGCVSNQRNPPVFGVPGEATRAGWRTQSTPASSGEAYNELSFEDAAGREEIFIRAQRNLVEQVQNDHDTQVHGQQQVRVEGAQQVSVGGDQKHSVEGDQLATVGGDQQQTVEGKRLLRFEGDEERQNRANRRDHVSGNRADTVEGTMNLAVREQRTVSIEGPDRYRAADLVTAHLQEDGILRANGSVTTVVGQAHAPRAMVHHVQGEISSYSTGRTEIVSDTELVLRCGESSLTLTPKSIELSAPTYLLQGKSGEVRADDMVIHAAQNLLAAGQLVTVKSPSALLGLSDGAELVGPNIKLKSDPVDANPELPGVDPITPTTIEVVDQLGAPIPERSISSFSTMARSEAALSTATARRRSSLPRPARSVFQRLGPSQARHRPSR